MNHEFSERGAALGQEPRRTHSIPDARKMRGMLDDLDDAMADIMTMVKDPKDGSQGSGSVSSYHTVTTEDSSSSSDDDEDDEYFSAREESIRYRHKLKPPPQASSISINSRDEANRRSSISLSIFKLKFSLNLDLLWTLQVEGY